VRFKNKICFRKKLLIFVLNQNKADRNGILIFASLNRVFSNVTNFNKVTN